MRKIVQLSTVLIMILVSSFLIACTSIVENKNNGSTLTDVLTHFQKSGVEIEEVVPLMTKTLGAQDAVVFVIAGNDVGIYKFNIKVKVQRERLEFAQKNKYIYIVGRKHRAIVNGSFIMVAANSNKDKKKIIKAFNSFSN